MSDSPAKLTVLSQLFDRADLSAVEKCVLARIILHTNASFANAFPGASKLAVAASVVKRDPVFKALKRLEALGMIARQSGGAGHSNIYSVNPEKVAATPASAKMAKTRPSQKDALAKGTPRLEEHDPSLLGGRDPSRLEGHYPVSDPVSDPVQDARHVPNLITALQPEPSAKPQSSAAKATRQPNPRSCPIVVEALAAFNSAADRQGFARATALTVDRAAKLAKRLDDLGEGNRATGLERFNQALDAIPLDRFLSGKVSPAKPGHKPFRLDLERLLSTGSGVGDVLAKLLDLHADRNRTKQPSPGKTVSANGWALAIAEEAEAQRRRFERGNEWEPSLDLH